MHVDGFNERVVVDSSSSNNTYVISVVVGSFVVSKVISRDLLDLIGVSLDWLSEHMVTIRVEMTILKSSLLVGLEVSIML